MFFIRTTIFTEYRRLLRRWRIAVWAAPPAPGPEEGPRPHGGGGGPSRHGRHKSTPGEQRGNIITPNRALFITLFDKYAVLYNR